MIGLVRLVVCVSTFTLGYGGHHSFYYNRPSFPTKSETTYYTPQTTTERPKGPPQQNCTVENETVEVEFCIPDVRMNCMSPDMMGMSVVDEEQCFKIDSLDCSEEDVEIKTNICSYTYESKETKKQVKTVEIEFEKKCTHNKVTVCQPQGIYGGYHKEHYGPKCEEIEQNSCYNQPKATEKMREVTLELPEPKKECSEKSFKVPKVTCRTKSEEKCIRVPKVKQTAGDDVQKCVPQISGDKCENIRLSLPKQVCKDLIVGSARPVTQYQNKFF